MQKFFEQLFISLNGEKVGVFFVGFFFKFPAVIL